MRVAIAPGVWRDDGPQSVTAHVNNFAVGAVTGDRMVPTIVSANIGATAAEMARRDRKRQKRQDAARIAREIDPAPKVVCGALLRIIGEPCARRPGHHDSHRSRSAMDTDRDVRQRGYRATDG